MSRKLLAIGIPTLLLVILGGGLWLGWFKGLIPPAVFNYLWPALVAFAFLLFCLVALFLRGRRWLWPLGTGFLVQSFGMA